MWANAADDDWNAPKYFNHIDIGGNTGGFNEPDFFKIIYLCGGIM